MTDTEAVTEHFVLTWEQIVALYVSLNEYTRPGEIDFLSSSATTIPRQRPLPRCPVCDSSTDMLQQRADRITPGQEYSFQPCGHVVHIAELDIQRLWDRTKYRESSFNAERGSCSCRAQHCSGCWLGHDLDMAARARLGIS